MARKNYDEWVPEEFDSAVIHKVNAVSAVEAYGKPHPMSTQTKSVPRSAGMSVGMIAKGGAYGEDTSAADEVVLHAQKFGQAIRIAEEDLDDSLADVIAAGQIDWATAYAKTFDNACLAVTAAKGTSGCAFDSLYYLLTQNNSDTGYVANSNLTKTGTGGVTYDALSEALGLVETGDYFDEAQMIVIAHPSFRQILREIRNDNGDPIFNESTNGTAGGGQGATSATLFGHPVHWSLGAKTSAAPTDKPTGNPLLVFANRDYLLRGDRSGVESVFIDGRSGLAALTDEAILKMRARKAFAPGVEQAFAILEDDTPAA
ncbi:phage major capsid protein [Pseudonocardia lutea]|uniref:Phage major capsid protein n=1 Tax=Pseudonocardia lutea TaxID=2172015 RepID=A0ABW1I1U0_9PSEU